MRSRRLPVALLVALALGAAAFVAFRDGEPDRSPAAGGESGSLPNLQPPPAHLPVPESAPAEAQVDSIMRLWRTAIQGRDADTVLSCEQMFRDHPAKFTPALIASAESDSEDRVRAFSARVLGKLQDPALVPVFRRLLADRSEHVRGNGAWALGQLGTPEAIVELERLRKADPTAHVRQAATQALHARSGAERQVP